MGLLSWADHYKCDFGPYLSQFGYQRQREG